MPEKSSSISSVERLFNLCAFLIRERDLVTLRTIILEVEGYSPEKDITSNRRMFHRDRKELEQLGIGMRTQRIPDPASGAMVEGYTIEQDDFYLPKIDLSPAETETLAELAAQVRHGAGAFPELETALAKLTGRAAVDRAPPVLVEGDGFRTPARLLDSLRRAVLERKRIEIKYRSANSSRSSRREVEPYGMFLRHGLWYLYGFCRLRRGERIFRLDRLELLRGPGGGEGPDFELPPGFSLAESVGGRAPWEFGADPATEAVLAFDADTFWQAKNLWGSTRDTAFDDAKRTMKVLSVNNRALVRIVLGYAGAAEIVSPPSLRKKAAAELKKIIAAAGKRK